MKKVKIIGLLVACGGVVASFAAASALYLQGSEEIGFGIGATYQAADGSIAYQIDGKSSGSIDASYLKANGENGGEGLGGEYTQACFEFPVGATFSVNPQPYVVGNFSVSLTNINSALVDHAHIWIEVKGWTGEYEGKYGSSNENAHFMDSDEAISATSYTKAKDIAVSSTEEQSVFVYFKLDSAVTDAATMLALAESKPFDIAATWGAPASYEFAHVVGSKTQWQEDEIYAMMPNLKADSFSWYFAGLTGFKDGKAKKGDAWAPGDDAELDPAKTYNVSWTGGTEDIPANQTYFSEVI